MNEHRHSPPVVLTVCSSAEEVLVIESLLACEGILFLRDESPSFVGEALVGQTAGAPTEVVAIYVPGCQVDAARLVLAEAREMASAVHSE